MACTCEPGGLREPLEFVAHAQRVLSYRSKSAIVVLLWAVFAFVCVCSPLWTGVKSARQRLGLAGDVQSVELMMIELVTPSKDGRC